MIWSLTVTTTCPTYTLTDMLDELLLENTDNYGLTFSEYRGIVEGFHNFLPNDVAKKQQHAAEVHAMIMKAYEPLGGNHSPDFATPESMVKGIPMWKVHKKGVKITSVAMYKDAGGRKRVAIATNGEADGKASAGEIVSNDLKRNRAFMEVSDRSLSFLKKQLDLGKHVRSYDHALAYHAKRGDTISRPAADDPEVLRHPEFKDHFYVRDIGGHQHTKLLLGHISGVPITNR